MLTIKCSNITDSWISFYDHNYINHLLSLGDFVIIKDVPDNKLSYYQSLSKIGIGIVATSVEEAVVQAEEPIDVVEEVEEVEVEDVVEDVVEEVVEDVVEDEVPTDLDSMSKSEIKSILKSRNIQFKNGDTKAELIDRLVNKDGRCE